MLGRVGIVEAGGPLRGRQRPGRHLPQQTLVQAQRLRRQRGDALGAGLRGGGLEIAAGCDIRLAGPDARFGVPIARLGFPMAPAEVELVAAAIGPALLRELLIDARLLDADEALRRGLVSRVIGGDAQALTAEVARTAERIAALSPQALRLNKQVLRAFAGRGAGGGSSRDDRLPHYGYADSAEHREGLRAFLEKRPPAW